MKFGKLPDIRRIDFSLPPQSERSLVVLGGQKAGNFRVFTGAPIWGNREWIGKIYPKGAKQGEFLKHYSGQFTTVELNPTHYQIPPVERIEKWYALAQEGFRFCPKVPQEISHRRLLMNCEDRIQLFCDTISHFREKLGCVFLQLPPRFGSKFLYKVEHFLSVWPTHIPLAIEFRHEDWFGNGELDAEACDLLESFSIATLITDVAGRRDVSHSTITSKTAMVRFVGNDLHPTDFERIYAWVERISLWVDNGLEQLYFFIHEPKELHSPDLLAYFSDKMNKAIGTDLRMPGLEDEGGQMELF